MDKINRFLFNLGLLLLLCNCSAAQMSDSVLKYYFYKNIAESHILDSNYKAANNDYQMAFLFKKPNLRDIYNALIVAYEAMDSARAKYLYSDLVLHGMRQERFELLTFAKQVKNEAFYGWLKSGYDSLKTSSAKNVNHAYIAFLDKIYNRDQKIRYAKASPEEISRVDLMNLNEVKDYIENNGYPSYDKVGMFEASYEGWISYYSTMWLILLHSRHLSTVLNDILLKSLNAGEMASDDYACLTDFQRETPYYYVVLPKIIKDTEDVKTALPNNLKIVNEQRGKIGLEDLRIYKRKLEFMKIDRRFYFVPSYLIALQYAKFDMPQF